MAKQSPIPDELTKPFFDACNEERLVVQNCTACDRLTHPPKPACDKCGSSSNLEWKPVSGKGKIYNYGVVHDCPVKLLQDEQPFNLAVITLEEDSGIQMYSHLKDCPVDEVPVGAPVEVIFEVTPGNGQKVPEWKVAQ